MSIYRGRMVSLHNKPKPQGFIMCYNMRKKKSANVFMTALLNKVPLWFGSVLLLVLSVLVQLEMHPFMPLWQYNPKNSNLPCYVNDI